MFIACNSLISTPESEKRAVAWIHWLVEQAAHFEQVCLSVILLCFNLKVSVISLNLKSNYVMRPIFDVVLNLVFEFDWWLNKHQFLLSQVTGLSASFGEMLLLMAIHFHSNQLSAIGDLVCQTLGMKIVIRTNSMSRKISHVFTHEIFNEQVLETNHSFEKSLQFCVVLIINSLFCSFFSSLQAVAAHAVRVPVTPALSANMSGFLPVHCIHQLLKSRAFSKHKVPIKDWIYR